jgi:hypothetical protein
VKVDRENENVSEVVCVLIVTLVVVETETEVVTVEDCAWLDTEADGVAVSVADGETELRDSLSVATVSEIVEIVPVISERDDPLNVCRVCETEYEYGVLLIVAEMVQAVTETVVLRLGDDVGVFVGVAFAASANGIVEDHNNHESRKKMTTRSLPRSCSEGGGGSGGVQQQTATGTSALLFVFTFSLFALELQRAAELLALSCLCCFRCFCRCGTSSAISSLFRHGQFILILVIESSSCTVPSPPYPRMAQLAK